MTTPDMENGSTHGPKETWRDDALDACLRGFDNNENMDALIQAIRKVKPAAALQTLWSDGLQALNYLQSEAINFRKVSSGSVNYSEGDHPAPFMGWYAGEWEGSPVEVAIVPGGSDLICIAEEEGIAWRLIQELETHAIRPLGRCLTYFQGWKSDLDLDAEMGKVTWDDIVLEPGLLASVHESIESFSANRSAFEAMGFPWKRGVLLIGPPGTGKTMICKAAAASLLEWPFLYVRSFRCGKEDESLRAVFERARKLSPCILAFEDLDGLIEEHSRAVFLNELDGFKNNEGLLVIASSNHPGKIDEALLKRPSRFDRVFHIGLPAVAERQTYCAHVLTRSTLADRISPTLDLDALTARIAEGSEGFTPAYLKEVLVSAALTRAQAGAMVLDEGFAEAALVQVEELRQHLRRMKDPTALAEMETDAPVGFRRRL